MRKVLATSGLAATLVGAALLGPAASADALEDNDGILNGNDIAVQAPINVCGNQVNVIAVPVLNSQSAVCTAIANADQGIDIDAEKDHDWDKNHHDY